MADKNTTSNINLAAAEELPKAQSKFKEFVKKFMKRKTAVISLAFIVFIILMAIIELLLRISGLIAVGFIIFGSIQYITSQGSPDSLKGAKSTITNAIVGLVIAMVATGFIQFLGGVFQ